MKVELLRAWPRRYQSLVLDLPDGARVDEALRTAGWADDPAVDGYAVYGVAATPATVLRDGDRLELLRPLEVDPKEARRRRAAARK